MTIQWRARNDGKARVIFFIFILFYFTFIFILFSYFYILSPIYYFIFIFIFIFILFYFLILFIILYLLLLFYFYFFSILIAYFLLLHAMLFLNKHLPCIVELKDTLPMCFKHTIHFNKRYTCHVFWKSTWFCTWGLTTLPLPFTKTVYLYLLLYLSQKDALAMS